NALQTLLPQIHAEIREEFRTSSGPSDSGGNPPPVTIHTWLERFNKQKPRSFEKATAPVKNPDDETYDVEAIRSRRPVNISAEDWDEHIRFWSDPKNSLGTYTDDQIMAMVHGGKKRGYILGVGRVLAGRGKDVLDVLVPRCNHSFDVNELKRRNKQLQKQIDMNESKSGSGSGSGRDDESGNDEDANEDEDDADS
nr:hypothetical protein [Tanacetum cinerariifolium]